MISGRHLLTHHPQQFAIVHQEHWRSSRVHANFKPYSTDLHPKIFQACEQGIGLQRAVAK